MVCHQTWDFAKMCLPSSPRPSGSTGHNRAERIRKKGEKRRRRTRGDSDCCSFNASDRFTFKNPIPCHPVRRLCNAASRRPCFGISGRRPSQGCLESIFQTQLASHQAPQSSCWKRCHSVTSESRWTRDTLRDQSSLERRKEK